MKALHIFFHSLLIFVFFGTGKLSANYSPDKVQDYKAIVNAWNDAHNNWHFKDLENLYTDKVLFYGSTMNKKECISYKTNLASPTKIFVQKVASEIEAVEYGKGIIKCMFTKEVIIDDKKAQYPAYLILKETDSGLKIVCESDEITDASFGFELSQDLFQPKKEGEGTSAPVEEQGKSSNLLLYSFGSAALLLIIVVAMRMRKKKQENS